MNENLKVGLLYISLHNQLVKKIGVNRTISRKDFFCIIGKHFLVPKNLRMVVIKEMENKNLIKQTSQEIIILKQEYDLENNINKFYKMVGL